MLREDVRWTLVRDHVENNYFTHHADTYSGNLDDYYSLGDNNGTNNFLTDSGYVILYTLRRAEETNGPE